MPTSFGAQKCGMVMSVTTQIIFPYMSDAHAPAMDIQKRVSVKRSYGRVTGVGHTSLSSASIRSGEIIIPIKCGTKGGGPSPILGSARVHCAHLAREESVHRAPQRWAFDDLSPLHMQAQRQGWASRPVSKGMHAGHKSEMGAGQVSGYVSYQADFHTSSTHTPTRDT